jgi:hypothetical protein
MNRFKYLIIAILLFGFQGCYTILWSPSLSNSSNHEIDYTTNIWYDPPYYRLWDYYYNSPWWTSYTSTYTGYKRDEDKGYQNLRNNTSERNEQPRERPRFEPTSPPPSIDTNSGSTTTSSQNNSSGSTNNTRESKKDDNNNLRNNDGNRSNDKNRR